MTNSDVVIREEGLGKTSGRDTPCCAAPQVVRR
jgi:hypothetical protein